MSSLPLDDVQQVFAALTILYAIECAWWLRGATWRFFAPPFAAWSDRPADGPIVDAWRLSVSNPLPFTTAYASEAFPFVFDPHSLLVPVLDPSTGEEHFRAVRFSAIEAVTSVERRVLVDGRTVGDFTTPAFAAITASRLDRIRRAPPEARGRVAEEIIAEMHDVAAATRRLDAWRSASSAARLWGGTLTVIALLVGPVVWSSRGMLPPDAPAGVLALAVLLWLGTAVAALMIPGRLLAEGRSVGGQRVIAFLSPATAMRIHDGLGRDTLVGFVPLVVALATAKGGRNVDVVAAHLRAAVHPARPPSGAAEDRAARESTEQARAWFEERVAFHAREAVTATGLDPDALLTAVDAEPGARSFCPRCARTYVQPEGRCDVCGLALRHL